MSSYLNNKSYDLFRYIVDLLHINVNTVILFIASIIGICGGFTAVGFFKLIVFIQTIAIGGSTDVLDLLSELPWYVKLLLPSIGGLIVVTSIPEIIGGIGLLKKQGWARILVLILGFLNLLDIPIGTALGVYTIWVLLKEESAQILSPA